MFLSLNLRQFIAVLVTAACSTAATAAAQESPPEKQKEAARGEGLNFYVGSNGPYPIALDFGFPVQRTPDLGLEVSDAEPALRAQLDLLQDQGLVVTSVVPNSAADAAGVKQNDVLLTVGDKPVGSAETFRQSLATTSQTWNTENGAKLPLSLLLLRAGKKTTVVLSPQLTDLNRLTAQLVVANADSQKYWIGIAVADIDATLRSQLNLPENQGLVITEVYPDQAAEKAGLKVHDVLLEFNDKVLATADDLKTSVNDLGKDAKTGSMKLLRGGKLATLPVTPVEKKVELAFIKASDALLAGTLTNADQQDLTAAVSLNNYLNVYNQQQDLGRRLLITSTPPSANQWAATGQPLNYYSTLLAVNQSASQYKELLDAIQQLSKKIEALEQAVKKSGETSGK